MHKFKVTFLRDYLSSSQGGPHKSVVVSADDYTLDGDGSHHKWFNFTTNGEIAASIAAQNVHNIVRLDCDGGGDDPITQ